MVDKKEIRFHSTLGKTRLGSPSLRTTVPDGIAQALDLKEKDKLDWVLHTQGEVYSVVLKKGSK